MRTGIAAQGPEELKMRFEEWAGSRTSRLGVWDLALIKWSCIATGILLSRLVPASRRIDNRVLAAIAIGLAAKPAITVLLARAPAH